MNRLLAFGRGILGVLVGYAAMGGLITLVQEVWLGGVTYQKSSALVLVAAGVGTFLSAIAGGFIAALIGPHRPLLVGAAMCALAITETTWLVTTGRVGGPLWFDVGGAASLLAGMMLGVSWKMIGECLRTRRQVAA